MSFKAVPLRTSDLYRRFASRKRLYRYPATFIYLFIHLFLLLVVVVVLLEDYGSAGVNGI